MPDYIERDAVVALIEDKQRELCPLGRLSRNAVYGSNRDAFDAWQEIIDAIEAMPAFVPTTPERNKHTDVEDERSKYQCMKSVLETIMGTQKFCALCANTQCKNAMTVEATCEPIWNGMPI